MTSLRFPWDNERRVRALSEHGPGRPEVMGDIIADVEQLREEVARWCAHYNNLIGYIPPRMLREINSGKARWYGHGQSRPEDI